MLHYNTIEEFRHAMLADGIQYHGEIIADGELHRFHIEGDKAGTRNGAYKLHTDGWPAGWYQDHKDGGAIHKWKSGARPAEPNPFSTIDFAKKKKAREDDIALKRELAIREISIIREFGEQATNDHPYLVRKKIRLTEPMLVWRGALVVPIYNHSYKLANVQLIHPDGTKLFLKGGEIKGCFGCMKIRNKADTTLICEGWATGASLYEHSPHNVLIALNAGNLLSVARFIRSKRPDERIIICGDNDVSGVGQEAAIRAARAVNAEIAIPDKPGDWNDILTEGGAL
ncbi:toprim domain-containing protein [Nitrosomonas sp. ANs5]|uniref:toprim domain-containing protein n=1 Tax=Nitrosomonas sp. ANs5 TaxID=3423941 RepID=UPI003D35866A